MPHNPWERAVAEFVRGEKQGQVGIVTIARPERRNALNLQVKREIVEHVQAFAVDADVAAIVLTGEGGYLVAGTDIAEMAQMSPTDHVRLDTDRVFHVVRQSSKPVIAAVEGYALGGGCELALACDMIVAADDAQFGQPEIRVGIMPGAGGTQRLLRTVGRYKTLLWSLTGQMIPAREAFAANLVSELVPKGQALSRSVQIAQQDWQLDEMVSRQDEIAGHLLRSEDAREGAAAFAEKRPPRWRGR